MPRLDRVGTFQIAVVLLYGSVSATPSPDTLRERPRVEYVRVEEKECLQPVVRGPGVTRQDYRAAAARWLEWNHPGSKLPFWQTHLMLTPGLVSGPVTVVSERASGTTAWGEKLEVCFDVNFTYDEP